MVVASHSGASHTYVTTETELRDVIEGEGFVSVANGQSERITEIGSLGPLRGARRVNSFTRTLVSVRDLVEQFGPVRFDEDGVHISTSDGKTAKIGRPLSSRLYSFDLKSFSRHVRGKEIAGAA